MGLNFLDSEPHSQPYGPLVFIFSREPLLGTEQVDQVARGPAAASF